MPKPENKQFFWFFVYAATAAAAVHFHNYGTATFFGICTLAILEGW